MKLIEVKVTQLFGTYDYNIELNKDESVTILHAPNGLGKTTVLKLIQAVMEGNILYLDETPFKEIQLCFKEGDIIKVIKESIFESMLDMDFTVVRNKTVHKMENVLPIKYYIENEKIKKTYNISLNSDMLMMLIRRFGPAYRRINAENDGIGQTLRDILYDDDLQSGIFEAGELFEQLQSYVDKFNIHVIEANRIFKSIPDMDAPIIKKRKDRNYQVESIKLYSTELREKIDSVKREYANMSEKLDRTFPNRVLRLILGETDKNILSEDDIREALHQLE